MRVRIDPQAEAELQAAAQWYEDRVEGLGESFISETIDAFLDIEKHPMRFARAPYRTSRQIRRRLLEHFPYSVVYEVGEKDECVVIAIAHHKQRPGYWRKRIG